MNKETLLSLFRIFLTALGSYLFGKEFFGHTIDENYWIELSGVAIAVFSTIWGIADKTAGIEQIQSAVRSVIIIVSGIAVGKGWINEATVTAILAAIPIIMTAIQSETARKKVTQIKKGTLDVQALKSNPVKSTV